MPKRRRKQPSDKIAEEMITDTLVSITNLLAVSFRLSEIAENAETVGLADLAGCCDIVGTGTWNLAQAFRTQVCAIAAQRNLDNV